MAFNDHFARRMAEKYGLELVDTGEGGLGVWNDKLIDALVEAGKVLQTEADAEEFGKVHRMCWLKDRAYVTGDGGKVAAILDGKLIRAIWDNEG